MSRPNYEELGFKCGIEIHQQLEGKKLFCNCPTDIRKDKPDFEIVRRLRASAGEEGRVDAAALHEQKKQKYFIYQGYYDLTCGVELDEEPPQPTNTEALKTALRVAKMLGCRIVDKIQVMRKTVIDGSNVSGFQRTALIGMNGCLEVGGKMYGIESVCLEEEACQLVKRTEDHDIYNLSRLGIPLLEIATAPDMKTPEEAREVAAKIGMILRSTGSCKRGIGSIRQDVNLSIKGGSRVEIKGFQELKSIPKVIEYEVERQLKIIKNGEKMKEEVRKAEADLTTSFLRPMPGTDRMYPETDIPEITPNVKGIEAIKTIEERIEEAMGQFSLAKELATQAVKAGIDLAGYAERYANLEPKFIADTLINAPKEIKARFKKEVDALKHADELFDKVNRGELPKGAVFEILSEIAHGKKPDLSGYKSLSAKELEAEIITLVKKQKDATTQALMGLIMGKHRGKVDGKTVMDLLKKHKK
ncbi:Glu-tRNA(Gln) amidotransferase subunit GatE [Candidatus Woesearchaeota archaeon]|nr:Glu-tRNA(Gln) amidotransferase subunit GatE [Candidatus Woesearchaeota archaeon]